jgi:hypothetical protein
VVWTITAAGAWNIYLDGIIVCNGCRTKSLPSTTWTRLFLGRAAAATDVWFTGAIDDFMVFSGILTQVQVSTLYANSSGGAGLLSFPDFGGAIYAQSSSTLTINGTNFTGNVAGRNGGAIYVDRFSGLNLSNSQFVSNVANMHGGGVAMDLSYRPITLTNIVAQGNTANYGDGGFLYINGACYLYSNNMWQNLNCALNSASLGRGGCIFLNNSQSVTMIPYDVNIVNPVLGSGNQALLGNFIFSDESWIKIAGNIVLSSSQDAASLNGLQTICPTYPCTVTNFYSGDPSPWFNQRCAAGQAMHPVTKDRCITPYDAATADVISLAANGVDLVVLWPGVYSPSSRVCGITFSVSGSFKSLTLAGLGFNYNDTRIDCGNTAPSFTANVNFNLAFQNIFFDNAARLVCTGCTLNLTDVWYRKMLYNTAETFFSLDVSGSVNPALNTAGTVIIDGGSQIKVNSNILVRISNIDVRRSSISGDMLRFSGHARPWNTGSPFIMSCSSSSSPWVWDVKTLAYSFHGPNDPRYPTSNGIVFSGCNIVIRSFESYEVACGTPLSVTSSSQLLITSSITLSAGRLGMYDNIGAWTYTMICSMPPFIVIDATSSLVLGAGAAATVTRVQQTMFDIKGSLIMQSLSSALFKDTRSAVFLLNGPGTPQLILSGSNMLFTNNSGVNGSIFAVNSGVGSLNVSISNSVFASNVASDSGGVLYYEGDLKTFSSAPTTAFQCRSCTFTGNTAGNRGAVIFTEKFSPEISFIDSLFVDNCASSAGSRHAISMGYFPPTITSSWTPLSLVNPTFQRSVGRNYSNCPYIKASRGVRITGGNLLSSSSDAVDIVLPGLEPTGTVIESFYSGDYVVESMVLENSISLSFLSNGFDSSGRMIDSTIFFLMPGIYSSSINGVCGLNFPSASNFYSNVTLIGNGSSPSDTVINCSSSALFATVGAGFTLTLKNLYILRGNTSGQPTVSVSGTLSTENVTIGGTLATSATSYGILCTGATATCNFAGNTIFEGINGGSALAAALYATASASVQMSGNLTIQNNVGTYALRIEQLSRSSSFTLQNLVVQRNSAGFLLFPSVTSSTGSVLFAVTQSTLLSGNTATSGHLIYSNIVSTQMVSISFGGDNLIISNNTYSAGSIILINNAALHPQGLPQISMTPRSLVDISNNTVSLQLIYCQGFCYFLVNVPSGNVTISGNTVTSTNTHLIHVAATSSRMQWSAANLTFTQNQLPTVTYALVDVSMGAGMINQLTVTNWVWVSPRSTAGPYFLFVDGSGTLSSFAGSFSNVYIAGAYGCVHGLPNGASTSFNMTLSGSLTVLGSTAGAVYAFRVYQGSSTGPRSRLLINGNYTFVGNSHGFTLADTYSDVVFANNTYGIVSNNTVTAAGVNLLQSTATSSAIAWNGVDLTVQNNVQPASTSVLACTIAATNTYSFLFSGTVLAENNMTARSTINFLTVTGSAGSFSFGGNNFIARGFQSVFSVVLTSTARLNRATFTGYFEISSRPGGTGAAVSISQAGLSPGANGVSLELAGFYNFSSNVAASNPIMNLVSNAVVYLVGAGGIVQNNRATGTGNQVLFNVASGSVLMFAGSIESMLPVMVNTTQFYRSAIHTFVSNTATYMTTCLPGTISFNSSGSTCFLNQTGALSCQVNSNSTCINCLPGNYVDINTVICKQCPAGSFTNMSGLSTCSACVGGKFAATRGSTICSNCPAGFSSTNLTTN